MQYVLRFFGFLFSWAVLGLIFGVAAFGAMVMLYLPGLPSHEELRNYSPPIVSRVYSGNGNLMDEYVRERRVFTPIDEIPDLVKNAFVSAEDKNFYTHWGVDPRGVVSAAVDAAQGGRLRGASTITQQVVKNFLLSGERALERKLREWIIAVQIEGVLSKDEILELYLNEIFLGQNSYGVTAAAMNYFGKTLDELSPQEAAYLASLPKAPSQRHPVRDRDAAVFWRNNTLREMGENGYLTPEATKAAQDSPFLTIQAGELSRPARARIGRSYFTEEIRRQLSRQFGADMLFEEGLAIRATQDPFLQDVAKKALQNGLIARDQEVGGYRGPLGQLEEDELIAEPAWRKALAAFDVPREVPENWHKAVVLKVGKFSVQVGIDSVPEDADGHYVPLKFTQWAKPQAADGTLGATPRKPSDVWSLGDVIFVEEVRTNGKFDHWAMRQIPELQGAFMAMDTRTGRVLALQGGFSYELSVFNRATQAKRQPGSSFKPFVYAAALDQGFTPATIIVDAPFVKDQGPGQDAWVPKNYSGRFYGASLMRVGIEKSLNLMTVRIADNIGMGVIGDYAERFGVYYDMPHHLSYSLGSGETTLYQLVAAYAMFANGGQRVEPTLVDRVQNRKGQTIYVHDKRECEGCAATSYENQPEPWVYSTAERVMSDVTAFQLVNMMQGVTRAGGTAPMFEDLGHPFAGKTGTTNEGRDAWFIGFTPTIVAGCFVGYDTPRPMGKGGTGGGLCAPIVKDFMEAAVQVTERAEFRAPNESVLVKMDRETGTRLPDDFEDGPFVVEVFAEGEEPEVGEVIQTVLGGAPGMLFDDLPDEILPEEPVTNPDGTIVIEEEPEIPLPQLPVINDFSGGGIY